ncbi:hypothetical protein RFI_14474, partial [Reticulomyxa filosa]
KKKKKKGNCYNNYQYYGGYPYGLMPYIPSADEYMFDFPVKMENNSSYNSNSSTSSSSSSSSGMSNNSSNGSNGQMHKRNENGDCFIHTNSENVTEKKVKTQKWQCDHCPMTFHYKKDKTNHEYMHTGEKPFACIYCGKKWKNKTALKRHVHIHTG